MDERKLTFSARRALTIVGSAQTRLFKETESQIDNQALREQDRLILKSVDGKRSVREVISQAGLDFEEGLHSVAWLVRTGFVYSDQEVARLIQEQSDRLAMFAELFSDREHGLEFWQTRISEIINRDSSLAGLAPGISWDDLNPEVIEPIPSPAQVRDYFLHLFVAMYDEAEEIYGTQAVLAKRILLDVKPRP